MTPLCLLHAWESTQRESIQYKIHTQCPYLAYKTSKQEKPLPGYAHAMPMPTWKAVAWWRMYIVQGYTLGLHPTNNADLGFWHTCSRTDLSGAAAASSNENVSMISGLTAQLPGV